MDPYPNSGESFDEAVDDTFDLIEEARTRANISYPIVDEFLEFLEDQLKAVPNITNIQTSKQKYNGIEYSRTISIEGQVLAYQMMYDLLMSQIQKAKTFQELAKKKRYDSK